MATDSVGTSAMGRVPERYGYLRVAQKIGLGTYKDIQVVGNSIEEVLKVYKEFPGHGPASYGEVWGR